ncbi:MAG: glycosyltransferase [Bdellovibrio sp.]|nr:glycosyltransferase [Bdellovibrio sp.]
MQLHEKVCLIIPCYNEASRLKIQDFLKADPHIFFIFVDDGSSDETGQIIQPYCNGRVHLLKLEKNVGKAEAVRQGMLYFSHNDFFSGIEWAGFWDADLATPLSEVAKFLHYTSLYTNVDSLWGSRVLRLGSRIVRSQKRHVLGRIFATALFCLFRVGSYDTQCGAKLFRRTIIHKAFGAPFISRWIFDIEILLLLKEHEIIEYPLSVWEDVAGSKLKISHQVFRVISDLWRIKRRYKNLANNFSTYN